MSQVSDDGVFSCAADLIRLCHAQVQAKGDREVCAGGFETSLQMRDAKADTMKCL